MKADILTVFCIYIFRIFEDEEDEEQKPHGESDGIVERVKISQNSKGQKVNHLEKRQSRAD